MKKVKFIMFIYLLIGVVSSCTKSASPRGLDGLTGDQGVDGTIRGKDGKDGKDFSKPIVSEWFEIRFENKDSYWEGFVDVQEITQEVLDKGEVAIFYDDGVNIHSLNLFTDNFQINQKLSLGRIAISSTFDITAGRFRYVIMSGSLNSSVSLYVSGKLQYQPLMSYLGVDD